MKKNKKKFNWDNAITWRDCRRLCVIGLAIGGIEILLTAVWYWWDNVSTTFNSMKKRLTELELWRTRKGKDGA